MTLDLSGGGLFKGFFDDLDLLNALVGNEVAVDLLDLTLEEGLDLSGILASELRKIGIDQRGENDIAGALVFSADNDALGDLFDQTEMLLNLLGEYILTVFQNDDGFQTAGDGNVTILIHGADISGAEPAVLGECFGSSLFILIVAEHDIGAADLDLTLGQTLIVFGNIAAPKVQRYANNPNELEKFLSDPKNQAIIKKLIGGG